MVRECLETGSFAPQNMTTEGYEMLHWSDSIYDFADVEEIKKMLSSIEEKTLEYTEAMHRLAYAIECQNSKKPEQ